MPLTPFSVDNVKGWTRATCVAFIALVCMDMDLSDASLLPKLEPIYRVMDKAWLVPMHVAGLQVCFERFSNNVSQ